MDNEIKFSVIIPVYNAEKYLKKCLKSVLNQTYDNYEIIAVNDGSTDRSGEILNKYSEKYPVIKYIYQENQGEFCARKTGILAATGDYITFIDPDDSYTSKALQTLRNELSKNNTDILEFGDQRTRLFFKRKEAPPAATRTNNKQFLSDYINGHGTFSYTVWNKTYRANIIKDSVKNFSIRLKIGADAYTNTLVLTSGKVQTVSFIPDVLYNYRQGSGVLSSINKTNLYQELMKSKFEIYKHILITINDNNIIRSIFIDTAAMTKYYAYLITEGISNNEEREKIISDIIFNNPTIREIRNFFAEEKTNLKDVRAIIDFSASQYNQYIMDYAEEFKSSLTPYQKLQRILHI